MDLRPGGAQALERAGFEAANLRQFSVRPERYKDADLGKSEPQAIYNALADLTAKAQGGCLLYFSSHGAPAGVVNVVTGDGEPVGDALVRHPAISLVTPCDPSKRAGLLAFRDRKSVV
mgnify:CR=1 FL=1